MDQHAAEQYAADATDQLKNAVAAGDADAANAVVDQVAADGYSGLAATLNTALTHTSLANDQLTVAERYAVWLVDSGIDDSVVDDTNEGGDPITEHGGTVTDDDASAGRALAFEVKDWINDNQAALLALVRGQAHVSYPAGTA